MQNGSMHKSKQLIKGGLISESFSILPKICHYPELFHFILVQDNNLEHFWRIDPIREQFSEI